MMKKFRKRPVVIEAEQFKLGNEPYPEGVVPVWYNAETGIISGESTKDDTRDHDGENMGFGIKTLEGWHLVTHDDWIITGVEGEKYPCKPAIFDKTYEPV